MRIRTVLIGFAIATVAVVGTATGASADSVGGFGAKYHHSVGEIHAGQAGLSWDSTSASLGAFGATTDH